MLGSDAAELAEISMYLKTNPYVNILEYKSLAANLFYKDKDGNVVNGYQKPLRLYLRLLRMFALPGATVLNLTFGTGSLELAAMETSAPANLRFISFEQNAYQYRNGWDRLKKACVPPSDMAAMLPDAESEEDFKKGLFELESDSESQE